ncbi:MAG: AAA family ATPase, partial [Desulfonatronovibrionaceae bacterium]
MTGHTFEENIRPTRLSDFVGQNDVRQNLEVYLRAALERGQHLDHTLLYGNPGLGKTTLAQIMASELGVNMVSTSGPVLEKSGDLAAIIT